MIYFSAVVPHAGMGNLGQNQVSTRGNSRAANAPQVERRETPQDILFGG